MDRLFEFAIIQATPDERRNERVNIGVAVATPTGLDIRLPEIRKLRALTGHRWDSVADAYCIQITQAWKAAGSLSHLADTPSGMSQVFTLATFGAMRATSGDYEDRIKSVIANLGDKPVLSRREKQERINTEISRVLKRAGVLG